MMNRIKKILPLLLGMVLMAAWVAFAAEGGGSGEEGHKELWGMIWRIVNFTILMVLLWKMLADMTRKFFGGRREEIANMIEQADKAKEDAEKQFAEVQQKLKNVETDIQEIKDAIMGELESEKDRIIQEGKVSAERIIQQAKWTAEQEVIKARKDLRDHVVDMAGDMASGMITQNMTPADQKQILEEYLDKVVKG
jgi:F-type H+-transporting ATPase subunit b